MSRHLSKEEYIEKLQAIGLMAYDLILFLDTHPDNAEALRDYKKISKNYQQLLVEFEKSYGPISHTGIYEETQTYNWTQDPWPWERQ
ncbi:MAG: spore coat protein CotJB [Turicibacter sp.]